MEPSAPLSTGLREALRSTPAPLIPPGLVVLALALGVGLSAGGLYLPSPWDGVSAAVASVALYLAGKGWQPPAWAAGRPVLPTALVPLALGASTVLLQVAEQLPVEWSATAFLAANVLALLAGRVEPVPTRPVTDPLKVSAAPVTSSSAARLLHVLLVVGLASGLSGCAAPLALQPEQQVVGGEALELRLSPEECSGLRREVRRASAVEMGGKALVAGLGAGSALHGALGDSRSAQVGLAVGTLLAGGVVAVADYLSDSAAQEHETHCLRP